MRFYKTFPQAINEIKRDIAEMGVRIHTKSVQNIDVSENPDYDSLELTNYTYTVLEPDWHHIPLQNSMWAETEFWERVQGIPVNPGTSWEFRREYWSQFLHNGHFDYTYPERMAGVLGDVIETLSKDSMTRRAFLPIFSHDEDRVDAFNRRIPCSLGYWFNIRGGQLNITYLLRSSDFSEHFNYDIYLADRLKCFIAERLGVSSGTFTHWIGSLHVFQKDIKGVF